MRTEAETIRKYLRGYPPLAHVTADVLERHEAEFEARIRLGRVVSRCTTAHPLHTRFTNKFGAFFFSEATVRPNPRC